MLTRFYTDVSQCFVSNRSYHNTIIINVSTRDGDNNINKLGYFLRHPQVVVYESAMYMTGMFRVTADVAILRMSPRNSCDPSKNHFKCVGISGLTLFCSINRFVVNHK